MEITTELDLWISLTQGCNQAVDKGEFESALGLAEKSLNEARRVLGFCWQKPQLSRTALTALVRSCLSCADLDQQHGQRKQSEERVLAQIEQLTNLVSNPRLPNPLRFHCARAVGSLLGEFQRRFCLCPNKNTRSVSRLWVARRAVLDFWQPGR